MKRLVFCACILLIAVSITFATVITASAHPGKTDSNGGHTDHSTGEYHYHHGYPAHSHYDIDGDGDIDCPYDFDDKTDRSSSKNGGSGNSGTYSEGYKEGYQAGKKYGYKIGLEEGKSVGYDKGFRDAQISTEDEHSKELRKNTTNTVLGTLAITFFVVLPIGTIIFESLPTKENKRKKSEIERLKDENTRLRNGAILQEISPDASIMIPDGIELTARYLPVKGIALNYRPYGDYTVYTSPHGAKYHCKYRCGNATKPLHFFNLPESMEPCKNCVSKDMYPQPLPEWYVQIANSESIADKGKEAMHMLNVITKDVGMTPECFLDTLYVNYLMKKGHTEADAEALLKQRKQDHNF